jgi:putative FmdB family regulatory protein
MPTYDYKCAVCDTRKEVFHSMKDEPAIVCDCGQPMTKTVPKNVNFVLKGLGWSGKNIKEKNYRLDKRKEIGKKMAENYDIPQISPNYKGEVCSSWEQAKQLAKADGVDAQRYDAQVDNLVSSQNKVKEKVEKLKRGEG